MIRLIHAELIKLATTRTARVFLIAAALMMFLVGSLTFAFTEYPSAATATDDMRGIATGITLALSLVFGATAMAGEFRHATIVPTALAAGDRTRPLFAAAVAYAAAGALIASVSVVMLGPCAVIFLDSSVQPSSGDFITLVASCALAGGLMTTIGAAFGATIRNQAGSVVALLLLIFIIDNALPRTVSEYTISAAGSALTQGLEGNADVPSFAGGLAILVAWAAIVGSAAIVLMKTRDLD